MTDEQINAFFEMVKVLLGGNKRKLSDGAIQELEELARLARAGAALEAMSDRSV